MGATLEEISKGHREKVAAAYTMTHVASGMVYVGSSSHVVKRHFRHKQDLKNNSHQNKTVQELYNQSPDFEFFYYIALDRDHAMSIEQQLIDHYRSTGKLINKFLDVRHPNKGGSISDDFKRRLREINLGKSLSEETRSKIGQALKGRAHSADRKRALSERLKGHKKSTEFRDRYILDRQTKFGKRIMVDGVIYPGLRAASRALGVSIPCLKGRSGSDKWPTWALVE
jgi:predicted GIY-YIG superfamily endonuclease